MLREREPLGLESGNSLEPLPTLGSQLGAWQIGVLGAEPIGRDAECVQSGVADVGRLQPADDVERFHAADGNDLGISVSLPGYREDRVGDGAEGGGDDRFVEVARHDLTRLPALPLPDHAGAFGQGLRCVRPQRGHHFGL
ncbi:hypothetical protein [Streptomyces sp. NPDC047009]|uniref:hypothetical protein n=1 Tax=Streptomyces sp. NPDC047009 TaxID=3154496 RepID=UPI0033CD741C